MQRADIEIVPGTLAPRADVLGANSSVHLDKVYITEQGTEGGLPIVDFAFTDHNGKRGFLSLSGRIVNTISAAVKGVNMRIHGVDEP